MSSGDNGDDRVVSKVVVAGKVDSLWSCDKAEEHSQEEIRTGKAIMRTSLANLIIED